jgi:hypothetical protein
MIDSAPNPLVSIVWPHFSLYPGGRPALGRQVQPAPDLVTPTLAPCLCEPMSKTSLSYDTPGRPTYAVRL